MLPLPKTSTSAETDPTTAKTEWVVIVIGQGLERDNGHEFDKAWRSLRSDTRVLYFDNRSPQSAVAGIVDAVSQAEGVVVAAAYVAHTQTRQVMENGKTSTSYGLLGTSGQLLERVLVSAPEKTIVVAFGSPYLIESFPQIQTYLCAYSMASTSEISAVKALFGEVQNQAKLPVTLPGVGVPYFDFGGWVYSVTEIAGSNTYSGIPFLGGCYLAMLSQRRDALDARQPERGFSLAWPTKRGQPP